MPRRILLAALLAAPLLCLPGAAAAQDAPGVFRLGLDGAIFALQTETLTQTTSSSYYGRTTEEIETSHNRFGLLAPRLGLRVGLLLGNLVILGARVGVESQGTEVDGVETSTSAWQLAPSVHLLVPTGAPVRPFVGGYVGVSGASTHTKDGSDETSRGGTSVLYGGELGLHIFAGNTVSIDLGLGIEGTSGTHDLDDGSRSSSQEIDVSTFEIAGFVGLSAWLGPSALGHDDPEPRGLPEARTFPPPSTPEVPAGEAYARLPMVSGTVDVWTDASAGPDAVWVRVARVYDYASLGSCPRIQLRSGGSSLDLPAEHRQRVVSAYVEEGLVGRTDLGTLGQLVHAPDAALDVCGLVLPMRDDARLALRGFLVNAHARSSAPPAPPPAPPDVAPQAEPPASGWDAPPPPPAAPPPTAAPPPPEQAPPSGGPNGTGPQTVL